MFYTTLKGQFFIFSSFFTTLFSVCEAKLNFRTARAACRDPKPAFAQHILTRRCGRVVTFEQELSVIIRGYYKNKVGCRCDFENTRFLFPEGGFISHQSGVILGRYFRDGYEKSRDSEREEYEKSRDSEPAGYEKSRDSARGV